MDTKTARRNFYKNKVFFSDKFDQKYTTERFPADIQFLLDEYIPKATLKQITKFMEKKYNRILKTFPSIEKALKKVMRAKLDNLPTEFKKIQFQKLSSHLKQNYENQELVLKGDNQYVLNSKTKNNVDSWKGFIFEDFNIKVPKNVKIHIDTANSRVVGNGFYKIFNLNAENRNEVILASTYDINNDDYKLNVKNGNFEREANNLIEKFNLFVQKMDKIENPEE